MESTNTQTNTPQHDERFGPGSDFEALCKISDAIGGEYAEALNQIRDATGRILEMQKHAQSTLPGAADTLGAAMAIIGKMADIAKTIQDRHIVALTAETASLGSNMLRCLDNTRKAIIAQAMLYEKMIVMEKRIGDLEALDAKPQDDELAHAAQDPSDAPGQSAEPDPRSPSPAPSAEPQDATASSAGDSTAPGV